MRQPRNACLPQRRNGSSRSPRDACLGEGVRRANRHYVARMVLRDKPRVRRVAAIVLRILAASAFAPVAG